VDELYNGTLASFRDKSITQEGCEYRSDILGVTDVNYDLTLALAKGPEYFGTVMISFNLTKVPEDAKPLFLDFVGKEIYDLEINGMKASNQAFRA
jgi:hypothetical protein